MEVARLKALELAKGLEPTPKNIDRVSKEASPDAAIWAFSQWQLRKRARAKFERADEMLFDRDGLEMATHEAVASAHAELFPSDEAIADLTCGIGSDLMALAARGNACGYEIDSGRAELARHNLRVHGLSAEVRCKDCLSERWTARYAYADPSRRAGGVRSIQPESFAPALDRLLPRMKELDFAALKLSPMLKDDFLAGLGGRIEFWSFKWECREAIIRFGEGNSFPFENRSPAAVARQVENGSVLPFGHANEAPSEDPGSFFFEADPAAIRLGGIGSLSLLAHIQLLGDSNGYLTSEKPEMPEWSSWLRKYRVLSYGHANERDIKSNLKKLDARVDAVKVRGALEEPFHWQKRLKVSGARSVVLALYPVKKSLRYALLDPCGVPEKLPRERKSPAENP